MTPAHSPEPALVYMGVTFLMGGMGLPDAKELGAWTRERAEVGSAVRTLRPEICPEAELERWCRLLPATFGVWEEGS